VPNSFQQSNWYSAAPELGLHGSWTPEVRMSGLERLAGACSGKSVLDLGAAEGLVANRFLQHGAALVHGFDIVLDRVMAARRICGKFQNAEFWQADFSDWRLFRAAHAECLLSRYDIVLYLGLHHHLPVAGRAAALEGAAAMTGDILALRTPDACYGEERIATRLHKQGFQLLQEHWNHDVQELGPLRIFRRSEDRTDNRC
jgi:SAM-dependent methyltransferase